MAKIRIWFHPLESQQVSSSSASRSLAPLIIFTVRATCEFTFPFLAVPRHALEKSTCIATKCRKNRLTVCIGVHCLVDECIQMSYTGNKIGIIMSLLPTGPCCLATVLRLMVAIKIYWLSLKTWPSIFLCVFICP